MKDNDNYLNNKLSVITTAKEQMASVKREKLRIYIEFGSELSQLARDVPSTKIRGQIIASRYPDSQFLDPALRANCKWLYEALNVKSHEAADILKVLGIDTIYDLGSENPTVIRRAYKVAKAHQAL